MASKKKPTPKQIAARKLFAQRAKAGLFAKKKKRNAGVVRLSESEAKRYSGKIRGLSSIGGSATKKKSSSRSKSAGTRHKSSAKRGATKGLFRSFRVGRAAGRGLKRGAKAVGRTAKATGRGFWHGLMKSNPGHQHLVSLPAHYQRMYEDIVTSPYAKKEYGPRVKEVAARITEKAAHHNISPSRFFRENPTFEVFGYSRYSKKHKMPIGKSKKLGTVKAFTKWGARRKVRRAERKIQKKTGLSGPLFGVGRRTKRKGKGKRGGLFGLNPSKRQTREHKTTRARRQQIVYRRQHGAPKKGAFRWNGPNAKELFESFRGKQAATKAQGVALPGTPKVLAQLGRLRTLTVGTKTYSFGEKARLCGAGRNMYICNVTMEPPAQYRGSEEIDLGPINGVTYDADKPHLGDDKIGTYKHSFRSAKEKPHLILVKDGHTYRPWIEGGSYELPSEGIDG